MIAVLLLAVAGGVLAVASPCVLPVLPFVLARTGRSTSRDVLPFMAGLTLAFSTAGAIVGAGAFSLASGALSRWWAPTWLALSAVALLSPRVALWMTRPLVRIGANVSSNRERRGSVAVAFITGAATGLVWAPCAGPILALVISAAATSEVTGSTLALLLLAFGSGSALVFALILSVGATAQRRLRDRWLPIQRRVEQALGAVALAAAALLLAGADASVFARVPSASTASVERALVHALAPRGISAAASSSLPDLGPMPSLDGGIGWLNSAPLSRDSVRGRVVLVEIWTFACYNCLNALPHIKEIAAKFAPRGLVTIGVHTPELPRERPRANVERAVHELGVTFPVVLDNNFTIWKAFNNEYWPSVYVVDRRGRIRFHHDGEGRYDDIANAVSTLLAEAP